MKEQNNIWIPVLPVEQRITPTIRNHAHKEFPNLFIFDNKDNIHYPAQYDSRKGLFFSTTSSVNSFSSDELVILDTPKVFYNYSKGERSGLPSIVPYRDIIFKLERLNYSITMEKYPFILFLTNCFKNLLKIATDYEYTTDSSTYIVKTFSKDASLRHKLFRGIVTKIATEENITKYCYATFDEVKDTVRNFQRPYHFGEDMYDKIEKLNKFLLYRAFQETIGKTEHYIVGQITGDTQNMHMPYVKIGVGK